jgi:triacylglycerol lipase
MANGTPPSAPVSPTIPANAFTQFNAETTNWDPQNARALVYASALAYQDPESIKSVAASWDFPADRVTVLSPSTSVLQAIVLGGNKAVVVAFRGTRPDQLRDWMADFEISQAPFTEYFTAPNIGSVHDGFAHLLARSWKDLVAEVVRFQDESQTLWITGHSLGGALALMAASAFVFAERLPVNGLYTFGQPRVGDLQFCNQCESQFGDNMFRFVNDEDIVTRVPPRVVPRIPLPEFYGHCGELRFFDENGGLHTDEHWWNAFLIGTDVGFENMRELLSEPVTDHELLQGYAAKLEKYIASLAP